MRFPTSWLMNFLCFFLLFHVACSFQTVFWFQIFGQVPSPLIWILFPIYFIVTKPGFTSLFFTYFLTFVASRYSSIHLGNLLIVMSLIAFLIMMLRSRIFWTGPSYYLLISFGSLFAFHVLFLVISFILEDNKASILFWDRFVQIILTIGFCYPAYVILQKIDSLFSTHEHFMPGFYGGEQKDL